MAEAGAFKEKALAPGYQHSVLHNPAMIVVMHVAHHFVDLEGRVQCLTRAAPPTFGGPLTQLTQKQLTRLPFLHMRKTRSDCQRLKHTGLYFISINICTLNFFSTHPRPLRY